VAAALRRFSLRSWVLLAALLLAHIVCFVVLVQQVDAQNRWAAGLDRLAGRQLGWVGRQP
jgi:hypothetical protein